MKKRVPVSQIMSVKPKVLNPTHSLSDAEKLFDDHNIRHIPIVEGDRVVGVVSRSDLLKASVTEFDDEKDKIESVVYDHISLPQVMTKNPITVNTETTIRETARILSLQSFNALPVLEEGKLAGIVTSTDLIQYLLDQY